jgi:hypothetical protein
MRSIARIILDPSQGQSKGKQHPRPTRVERNAPNIAPLLLARPVQMIAQPVCIEDNIQPVADKIDGLARASNPAAFSLSSSGAVAPDLAADP